MAMGRRLLVAQSELLVSLLARMRYLRKVKNQCTQIRKEKKQPVRPQTQGNGMIYMKALCCYRNDTHFDCFKRFGSLSTTGISATWLENVKLSGNVGKREVSGAHKIKESWLWLRNVCRELGLEEKIKRKVDSLGTVRINSSSPQIHTKTPLITLPSSPVINSPP